MTKIKTLRVDGRAGGITLRGPRGPKKTKVANFHLMQVKAPCNYCTFTTVISQSHIIFKKVEDINVNIPPFPSTCMVSISEGIQAIVTSSFLKVFQAQRSQVKLKNNL